MKIVSTKLCDFHDLSLEQAALETQKLSQTTASEIVITPNIDHMARLVEQNDQQLMSIYQDASLCLCDSNILQKLLSFKGIAIQFVVPGSSLTEYLFANVLSGDDKVLIIGGDEYVIKMMRNKYSHLTLDHYNPPMGFINKPDEVTKTVDICIESQPDYIFLAVGSPRQELLAKKVADTNAITPVMLCIGASILFLVDQEKRAPLWVQKIHMEWFYRMMQDPGRLVKRYGGNFLSLAKIYRAL